MTGQGSDPKDCSTPFFGALFFSLGLLAWAAFHTWPPMIRLWQLEQTGMEASANVVEVLRSPRAYTKITYTYTVFGTDGARYDLTATRPVPPELAAKGMITIRYLPDDPSVSDPHMSFKQVFQLHLGHFVCAFLLCSMMIVLGWLEWRKCRRKSQDQS